MKKNLCLILVLTLGLCTSSFIKAQITWSNNCNVTQISLDCEGLHFTLTPNTALTGAVAWSVTPGPFSNENGTAGTWMGTLPDDDTYTITANDGVVTNFTISIADLPVFEMTQAASTCGLLAADICLDTDDFNSAEWTDPSSSTSSGQCSSTFYAGDYTVEYTAYTSGFSSIPGECTTNIDTGIELSIDFSDPTNLDFDCANGGYTGFMTATATGGSGFYQYSWDGLGGGQTVPFTTPNTSGNFTVTVTDLVNDIECTASIQLNLAQMACVYDLNSDGVISVADMLILVAAFGCNTSCDPMDFDCSGEIDITDINNLSANYSTTCP